jgi:hypothetical protein
VQRPILHVNERRITVALSTWARSAEYPLFFVNCFGVAGLLVNSVLFTARGQ